MVKKARSILERAFFFIKKRMKKNDRNIIQIVVAVILMWLFLKKECPLKKEPQPQPMARKQEPIMKQETQSCNIDPELYERMTDNEFNPLH